MSFQIKDFTSIVASMINHARGVTDKITDFQPGSVARTLMEAPAVELEEFYLQVFAGLRDAIPVAVYRSFDFERLPPARAQGFARVTAEEPLAADIQIPLGTQFSTSSGRIYRSTAFVTWLAGTTSVLIPIRADVAGMVGNAAAGAITQSPFFGEGFTVSNNSISSGRDEESDEEREARFAQFIRSLSQGTVEACRYQASQARTFDNNGDVDEYVVRVGLTEIPGRVSIYIYGSAGTASDELIADAQRRMDGDREGGVPGVRSAGVRVDVLPMVEREVPFSARVAMFPGYSLNSITISALNDAYAALMDHVDPGEVLYVGAVVDALTSVEGVREVVPVTTSNVLCGPNEKLMPGDLTITAL